MFWITCSSQSTKLARKLCESVKAWRCVRQVAATITALLLCALPAYASKSPEFAPTPFAPTGVFNSIEMASLGAAPVVNWESFKGRLQQERKLASRCANNSESCPQILRDWQNKIGQWRNLNDAQQIAEVNRFANRSIRYTDDRKTFQKSDYWATPLQSLRGRGDCEDYALLKYETLLALGFAKQDLRIVVVIDQRKNIAHAVLSVKTARGTFILDNQDQRVLRDNAISYYAPLYSINEKGRWLNVATRTIKQPPQDTGIRVASIASTKSVMRLATPKQFIGAQAPLLTSSPIAPLVTDVTPVRARLQAVAAAALLMPSTIIAYGQPSVPFTMAETLHTWSDLISPFMNLLTRKIT